MTITRLAIAVTILTIAASTCHASQFWQSSWKCGKAATLDTAAIGQFFDGANSIRMLGDATSKNNVYLIADNITGSDQDQGAIMFVRRGGGLGGTWSAYPLSLGAAVSNVYVTASLKGIVIFLMEGNGEGASGRYHVVSSRDGFDTVSCNEMPPQVGFDNVNALRITDFNADANGRAVLVGTVENPPNKWFKATAQLGRDWPAAAKAPSKPASSPGLYKAVPEDQAFDLLNELKVFGVR